MRYVLDTNVVSELRKIGAGRCDRSVERWSSRVDPADMYLSAVTIYELEHGALLLGRRDPVRAAVLHAWLDDQLAITFKGRVLAVDAAVARRSAAFSVPDPWPFRDGLIAATAISHDMTVVTRNVRDFARTGVRLLNPWDA